MVCVTFGELELYDMISVTKAEILRRLFKRLKHEKRVELNQSPVGSDDEEMQDEDDESLHTGGSKTADAISQTDDNK